MKNFSSSNQLQTNCKPITNQSKSLIAMGMIAAAALFTSCEKAEVTPGTEAKPAKASTAYTVENGMLSFASVDGFRQTLEESTKNPKKFVGFGLEKGFESFAVLYEKALVDLETSKTEMEFARKLKKHEKVALVSADSTLEANIYSQIYAPFANADGMLLIEGYAYKHTKEGVIIGKDSEKVKKATLNTQDAALSIYNHNSGELKSDGKTRLMKTKVKCGTEYLIKQVNLKGDRRADLAARLYFSPVYVKDGVDFTDVVTEVTGTSMKKGLFKFVPYSTAHDLIIKSHWIDRENGVQERENDVVLTSQGDTRSLSYTRISASVWNTSASQSPWLGVFENYHHEYHHRGMGTPPEWVIARCTY